MKFIFLLSLQCTYTGISFISSCKHVNEYNMIDLMKVIVILYNCNCKSLKFIEGSSRSEGMGLFLILIKLIYPKFVTLGVFV